MKAVLKVLILSLIGGYVFSLLHIPIPWMLGPIVTIMITQFIYKGDLHWPSRLSNIGIVMVGSAIGMNFNIDLFGMIGSIIFYMVVLNLILIGGSIFIAYLTSLWTKIPLKASILGAIPGGLSQIVIFALEENVKEIGVISYFQVIRLLLVVFFVPFIVVGHAVHKAPSDATFSIELILYIILGWGFAFIAQKLRLSVAYFIAPIILFITLQLLTPLQMPAIPDLYMGIAQLVIGAHIGLMLKPDLVRLPWKVLLGGIFSALALIALTLVSSKLMTYALHTTFATSFLSTAPGGIDQMVLLANEINADGSLVSLFQTFRLLFIFIVILPLLKIVYRWYNKHLILKKNAQANSLKNL